MKARVKDTGKILEVLSVKLENGFYYSCDRVEIEKDLSNPIDHWQDVRERAVIAIAPQCLKIAQDVLFRGGAINEETVAKQVAVNAVDIADALIKKLKGA